MQACTPERSPELHEQGLTHTGRENRVGAAQLLGAMGAEIKDEYSELRISRQRKYYLRQRRRKKCTKCGKPVEEGSLCLEHLIQMRESRIVAMSFCEPRS